MHGQHRKDRQKWHMWPGPSKRPHNGTEADSACANYFFKAGRKIGIGDCAFFRPDNAPLFIGIIRKLSAEDEGNLNLSVNWLYRLGDINLGKGASVEAAPNEIFYSFHQDEISAASLLHPCKVAFLQKGVELPSSVSSYVCRRVYDTANKCLYWLTDQDYTDEHQAEVDQLLVRTKHEMQAAASSEGPSQRAARSPSPLKPETANASLSIQGKGKKRPRADQNQDSSKREKFVKVEGSDSRRDCSLKYEDFAKVADKHEGIANVFCTEQLFQVMLHECSDRVRKLVDVMSRRTLLASIIAATEEEECLTHFVQLGGLRILNDWLQEAHEGKLGDGSPKESDTVLEEFLLTLICALEKLPVDLDALKNCIVGKSVNKLRSHRNPEIQKKARKLVDAWKKQVNAEMKSSDEVKSGANTTTMWSSKPTTETHIPKLRIAKNSTFVKSATNGSNLGVDTKVSLQPSSGHKLHSGLAVPKENVAVVKEERSCSSGQSQNNSQSWCSGSGKGAGSLKEDAKSPSVTPVGNKTTGAMLRNHVHSSKGHLVVTLTNLQKDFSGKHKTHGLERTSSASLLEKGATDGVRAENLTNQRLIVRLPNPGRSPSHSISAGSLVDGSAINNKGSPPGYLGRHDHANESRTARVHAPGTVGEAKSVKCNGTSGLNIKEEVDRSCGAENEESACKPTSVEHKPKDLTGRCPPDVHEVMAKKAPRSSHTSPSRLVLDSAEGGIDLLASVAAREVLESERSFSGSTAGERQPISADSTIRSESIRHKDEKENQGAPATCPLEPAADCQKDSGPVQEIAQLADRPKCEATSSIEEKAPEDKARCIGTEAGSLGGSVAKDAISTKASDSQAVGYEAPISGDSDDHIVIAREEKKNGSSNGGSPAGECQTASPSRSLHYTTTLEHPTTPSEADFRVVTLGAASVPSICPNEGDSFACFEEDALEVARQVAKEVEEEVERYEAQDVNLGSLGIDTSRCEKVVEHAKPNQMLPNDASESVKDSKSVGMAMEAGTSMSTFRERVEATDKSKCLSSKVMEVEQVPPPSNDEGKHLEVAGDSMAATKDVRNVKDNASLAGAQEDSATSTDVVMAEQAASMPGKLPLLSEDNLCGSKEVERPIFDLNEGFVSDEAHVSATHSTISTQISATISPDPSSGVTVQANSLAAPIAVVAASKGHFFPPSNPTKSKGELGWKGSAATSAFRPAEPRRAAETSSHPPIDGSAAAFGSVDVSSQSEKQARFLDIDLNVADERLIEDSCLVARPPVPASSNEAPMASSGSGAFWPELDLNRLDGNDETMGHTTSISREVVLSRPRSMVPQTVPRVILDFDLNDGLGCEEAPAEEVSSHRSDPESSGRPITGRIQQNSDHVNVAPWYATSSFMPAAMAMPAFPAGRSEPSYPVVAAPGSKPLMAVGHNSVPFSNDLYRGAANSSSAVSYSATMPASFSYAGFPFGASFPYTSASYNMGSTPHIASTSAPPFLTANPSQLVSAGAMVSPYGRPYLMGGVRELSGADASASWVRSSLDLNSGPDVVVDVDARGDTRSNVGRSQLSYQQAASLNGTLKRKEPEGSYDPYRAGFKPMAWR